MESAGRGTGGAGASTAGAAGRGGSEQGGAAGGGAAGGSGGTSAGRDGGAGSTGADAASVDSGASGGMPAATDVYGTLAQGGGIRGSGAAFEDRLYNYELTVAAADWTWLNQNAAKEMFVPATIKIDGVDLGKVGLRYKGESTLTGCLGPSGNAEGADRKCPKFSFKVGFAEYAPETRYFGLKKINLHSLIDDPTKLHEKLAYRLFREMGIATARSTHARVTVNGVYKGIYAVTEHLADGRFTADKWPRDPDGNLYKYAWPGRLTQSMTAAYYAPKLETNTDAVPAVTHEKIIAFATDLRRATTSAELLGVLVKWSDPAWLARFMAVDTLIVDGDGPRRFQCRTADPFNCSSHNYYWYQTKGDKFLLVPWDLDLTWGLKDFDAQPTWDKPTANCATDRYMLWGWPHLFPSCDPILKGANGMRPLYIQAVKDLLAGPFNVPKLRADLDRWAAYISEAVMQDKAIVFADWQAAVSSFKSVLEAHRQRMAAIAQ